MAGRGGGGYKRVWVGAGGGGGVLYLFHAEGSGEGRTSGRVLWGFGVSSRCVWGRGGAGKAEPPICFLMQKIQFEQARRGLLQCLEVYGSMRAKGGYS